MHSTSFLAHAFLSSLADLKRERDAAKAANTKEKKKLIPRPQGQAGRSSGYNLQAEMGLDGNKTRYNRLIVRSLPFCISFQISLHVQRIVKDNTHQHLSVQKTLSKQDPKRLEQTIALVHSGGGGAQSLADSRSLRLPQLLLSSRVLRASGLSTT